MKKYPFYFIILFLCFSCNKKTTITPPPHSFPLTDTIIKDISYGNNSAYKLDLGLPGNRTAQAKLVILIHGGAWRSGDKSELNFITSGLTQITQ